MRYAAMIIDTPTTGYYQYFTVYAIDAPEGRRIHNLRWSEVHGAAMRQTRGYVEYRSTGNSGLWHFVAAGHTPEGFTCAACGELLTEDLEFLTCQNCHPERVSHG